jgi:hypothetical protein
VITRRLRRCAQVAHRARFAPRVHRRQALPLVVVAISLLAVGGPGRMLGVRELRAQETVVGGEAADLVMKQLAALRAHDFEAAYALSSKEMRRHFSRSEFEWMVKRAHPELASSVYAFVVRTHHNNGYVYVTAKVQGKNGTNVEALYEVVREGDALKVNALSSRRDEGVL